MIEYPFLIGDPVQVVRNRNVLGKVTRICCTSGLEMVFVRLAGYDSEAIYSPDELCICKCSTRIPKEYCYVRNG
jgi:hypothetical protein